MLNELNDLAQKKSKAEKVVQDYIKKKEEERIRKCVRSDKLEEFFEPVTKAVAAIPTTPADGQLVPTAVPVPNIMDIPVPPEPLAIDEPEDPDDPDDPQAGPQIVEMQPGGVNITRFDAEKELEGADLTNQQKIDMAISMNKKLGHMKSGAEFPQDIEYLQTKNREYYKKLQGKKTGKGLASKGSYKIDANGSFSDLLLDLEQLLEHNKLYGLDEKGQQVIDTSVDDDFIDFITKRYNPKQKYSDSAKRMIKKLVTLSQHPLVKSSGKYKNILCYDPVSLVYRLELLIAGVEAGNNNDEIINEGISILDTLLSNKDITEEQHEGIYRKYFE